MIHARPIDRGVQALPLALAAWLLARVGDAPAPPAAISVVLALGLALGGRQDFTPVTQWTVAGFAAGGGGVAMATLAPAGDAAGRVDRFWSIVAAAVLSAAASRLFVRSPQGGARVTVAMGFLAVAVAGETRVDIPYGLFAAVWLVAALAALRGDDPTRPRWYRAGRATTLATSTVLAAAGLVASGAARALPPIHARVSEIILGRMSTSEAVTGFTGSLELSGLDGILQSDTVVLRVYGPSDDYLRGAVYDRYDRAGWRCMRAGEIRPIETLTGPLRGNHVVEVRRVGGLAGRYFLPLSVGALATTRGLAGADPMGVVHVAPRDAGDVVWYRAGERSVLAPGIPTETDLRVPADVRAALTPLVTRWTAGATAPAHVIAALTTHLRLEYHYSLHAPPVARRRDPVVDFLLRHHRGHCEYFASALALLCRIAGVPARVVGGYRVSERNDIGGYLVVRERNAHTWVEAWQPGRGWQTIDATPGGGESRVQNAGTWRALADFTSALFDAAGAWLARRRPVDLLASAAVAAGILALVRWIRTRGTGSSLDAIAGDAPLPPYTLLAKTLSRAQVHRLNAEPLERFAVRVATALPGDTGRAASEAILAYAAHRYGAQGSLAEVSLALTRAAHAVANGVPMVTRLSVLPPPPPGE